MSDAIETGRKAQVDALDLGGTGRLLAWADEVLAEAGVAGSPEHATEIAGRLAGIVTEQRFVELAEAAGARTYAKWLGDQSLGDPLVHFDVFRVALVDAIAAARTGTTPQTVPQAAREEVDAEIRAQLEEDFAAVKSHWVHGARVEFGTPTA